MRTIATPIAAGRLPPEVRGDLPPDTLVRVSLEVLRDENGFQPQQAEELRRAVEEARRGEGLSPGFRTAEELLRHLRSGGSDEPV